MPIPGLCPQSLQRGFSKPHTQLHLYRVRWQIKNTKPTAKSRNALPQARSAYLLPQTKTNNQTEKQGTEPKPKHKQTQQLPPVKEGTLEVPSQQNSKQPAQRIANVQTEISTLDTEGANHRQGVYAQKHSVNELAI